LGSKARYGIVSICCQAAQGAKARAIATAANGIFANDTLPM